MKTKSRQSGTIIIEASIILPIFVFLFLTMYSVLSVSFTQLKVQSALNNAARQIGEYSYIYAMSGMKLKADGLYEEADNNKKEIKEKAIDNFSTVMDSLENVGEGASSAYQSLNAGADLKSLLETAKSVGNDASKGVEAGKNLASYIKSIANDPKLFLTSVLTIFASDLVEEVKHAIAGALAEWLCSKQLGEDFTAQINFDKSFLFPGTSSDIILVAEYEVQIAPYIPVDIKYTISQQVVTRGWLDGDGKYADKAKMKTITSNHYYKEQDNKWTTKGGYALDERSKEMREDKVNELKENGYYDLRNNYGLHLYNPTTNTFAYCGSKNPYYGLKSRDELDTEKAKAEIKDYYLDMIARFDTSIPSEIGYKEKSGNSSKTIKVDPYEVEKNGTEIKKELYISVPEDPGCAELYNEVWNSLTPDEKRGVSLTVEPKYGKYFDIYGEDD